MNNINKVKYGSIGEDIAADFLIKSGYRIIERNMRISRYGEIDIIAEQDEYICFVEVKTRKNILFGMPSEAVGKQKQGKIRLLAGMYLNMKKMTNSNVRFDIVEIITKVESDRIIAKSINLIKNAF